MIYGMFGSTIKRLSSYHLSAGLGSEHGKDPGPASNIQNDFVLEEMLVVEHGVPKI